MVNAAVCLSGGVANVFHTEICSSIDNPNMQMSYHAEATRNIVKIQYPKIDVIYPNSSELFELLQIAFDTKNLIGCHQNQVTLELFISN